MQSIPNSSAPVLVSSLSNSDLYDRLWKIKNNFPGKLGLRFCRGRKMHNLQGLYDELSAAFQFPYYFGENWAALDECLNDLSWFISDAYLLCITSADEVLKNEPAEEFEELISLLVRAAREWGGENPNLAVMGRSPTVFQTLVQVAPGSELVMQNRLQVLGFKASLL